MLGGQHFMFRDGMTDAEVVQRIQLAIDEDFNRTCSGTLWGKRTSGLTPLMLTISQDKRAAAAVLLQIPGIDINAETTNGDTALTCAIRKDDSSMVRRLLEAGARLENEKKKALQVALKMHSRSEPIIDLLLEFGASFKDITLKQGRGNAWFYGVDHNHFPLLKEQGHDINHVDPELGTPLYDLTKVMEEKHDSYLCALLEHGADPDIRHPTSNLLPIHRTIRRCLIGPSMQLLRAAKQEIPDLVTNGLVPLICDIANRPDDDNIKKMIGAIFMSPLYTETFRRYTEEATLIIQTALVDNAVAFGHGSLADYLFYELGLPMVAPDIKEVKKLFLYILKRKAADGFVWLHRHAPRIPDGSCFSKLLDNQVLSDVKPHMFRILVSYIPDYRPSDLAITDAYVNREYATDRLERLQTMLSLFPTGVPIREYPNFYSNVLSNHRAPTKTFLIGGVDMLTILENGLPADTQRVMQIQTNEYRNRLLLEETLERRMFRCLFKHRNQKLLEGVNPKRARDDSPLIPLTDDDASTRNSSKRPCRP